MAQTQAQAQEYMLDPKEAGVDLGKVSEPTERGWRLVTPHSWKFRTTQIADKAQVMDGYSDPDWWVDCTKARVVLDVYKKYEAMSIPEKTAKVDELMFDSQHITVRPNEELAGIWCNDEHGIGYDPRYDIWSTFVEMNDRKRCMLWENGKKVPVSKEMYDELEKFNEANNLEFFVKPLMPEKQFKMYKSNLRYFQETGTTGFRANPDHAWYLGEGLRSCISQMGETIDRLDRESLECPTNETYEIRQHIIECRAAVVAGESVVRWIKRHADEYGKAAEKETDPEQKERYEKIADACAWVSENAPRNFREAMQLHWLLYMAYYCIEYASHTSTFRPDQSFYSFFKKDVLDDKTTTEVEAADIIASYLFKYHEIGFLVSLAALRQLGLGARDYSTLTFGGQTADGRDATNELTMLWLDVTDGYRVHFPDHKIRWHRKFDPNRFKRIVEIMRTGMGSPSVRNDEVAIPGMIRQYGTDEVSLEDARSWAVVGCSTPGITESSKGATRRNAEFVNAFKSLEWAIFRGVDPEPGFEWATSVDTGDPAEMKDFDEFYQAWLKQWDWLMTTEMRGRNIVWYELDKRIRRPFLSLLYKDCVEKGYDAQLQNTTRLSFQMTPMFVDICDSMVGIKYWIYDKKKYTWPQVQEALKADWVGYEEMQQDFKDAPKFGNNDDYADDVFSSMIDDCHEIGKHVLDDRGQPTYPAIIPVTSMYMLAPQTGAMPNGRKRGEPLCDGGINPHADFDKSGPWGRLSSAMKMDQSKFKAFIYNQKWDYNTVKGDEGLDKMVDFTLTGLEGGMDQMQYNTVSKEVLYDAQKKPEKYPLLGIRVSGYSALYVHLPEYVQNCVIDRVEHEL